MRRYFYIFVFALLAAMSVAACSDDKKPSSNGGSGGSGSSPDLTVPDKLGYNVKGKVINQNTGEPIWDVVVSDGRLCTRTDENGMFWLKTDLSSQRCVFVCVPSGYEIPVDGDYCFRAYSKLDLTKKDEVQQFNFKLTPMSVSPNSYQVLFLGDPQIRSELEGSYEGFADVIKALQDYKKEASLPVYIISTGDLTYERPKENGYFKAQIGSAMMPAFNVPGNHDHIGFGNSEYDASLVDDTSKHPGDYTAVAPYVRDFGPNNYSANIGGVHYLFLDTIIWGNDEWWYDAEGFDDECLEFIENDLKFVDKNTPLFIVSHSPIGRVAASDGVGYTTWHRNFDKFNDLIAGRPVYNWAGHIHTAYNYRFPVDNNSPFKTSALETHQIARCTGALHVECEVTKDGVPRGFIVADVSGTEVKWKYKRAKPAGENGNDQMQIYTPADADPYMKDDGYVYVNIFLYDESTWGSPEWYENGVRKGVMTEYFDEGDPMYIKLWNEYQGSDKANHAPHGKDTRHLFRIKPSSGVASGEVRVKDRFGNEWIQTCKW